MKIPFCYGFSIILILKKKEAMLGTFMTADAARLEIPFFSWQMNEMSSSMSTR